MHLRFKIPSTLAVTILCSCHAGGHPVADALGDNITSITDAPAGDAVADVLPDAGVLADAAVQPDAATPDATVVQPDAAMPDADLA